MSKGSNRRPEDAAAIRRNWPFPDRAERAATAAAEAERQASGDFTGWTHGRFDAAAMGRPPYPMQDDAGVWRDAWTGAPCDPPDDAARRAGIRDVVRGLHLASLEDAAVDVCAPADEGGADGVR